VSPFHPSVGSPAAPALPAVGPAPGVADAQSRPALIEGAPSWMRLAAAGLVGYTLFLLTPTGQRVDGTALELVGHAARLLVEGAAFLWAARRVELPTRLLLALRLSGWTSIASAVTYLPPLVERLGYPPWISATTDSLLTLAGYVATLVALLIYPRAPARPGEGTPLAIDTAVSTGSLALLSWTLVTQVSQERATDATNELLILVFGVAQLALIAGLNVVVVRGLAVPSPRAFWWFVTGQVLYVPVTLAVQFQEAGLLPSWPGDVVYFLGVLPTFVACLAFRRDPMVLAGRGGPAWLHDLNPLPLSMPLLLGVALLLTLAVGPATSALPLAAALMAVSLLLAVRLLVSAHRTSLQARAEAEREQRRQGDRLQAVGRLAGGIAHEFNNLMARVVGHAELGEAAAEDATEVREHFAGARRAAVRAAELTSQLLAFSGQQRSQQTLVDAEATVHERYLRVVRDLPAAIQTELQRGPGPLAILADGAQLSDAVEQLIDNAVEAMPHGGRLSVRVAREQIHALTLLTPLSVPAGTYVVIAVADTGVGMAADAVAVACDPFYSTKPAHLGAGMGLASVHGFIAAHSGGLAIESEVGRGTTVRLYLPAA
jgi:signal transduction histidine kinase